MNDTVDNKHTVEALPAIPLTDVEESPADGSDLIYYTDESVDATLQKLVDLLNIPPFSTDRLSVKRVLGANRMGNCFSFSPVEIPITERVQDECGPGAYEVWIVTDKRTLYKRLKLNISENSVQEITQKVRPTRAPVSVQQAQPHTSVSESPEEDLERELESLRKENERLRNGGQNRSRGRNQRQNHQNPMQSLMDTVNILKEMGVIPDAKGSVATVEPVQSFDEILEERINTSKILGFERPEGGSAGMGDDSSFFNTDFATEALGSLLGMAGPALDAWSMSVHLKKDELRMANGLPPLHLGEVESPQKTPHGAEATTEDKAKPSQEKTDSRQPAAKTHGSVVGMSEGSFMKQQQKAFEGFLPVLMTKAQDNRDPDFWGDYIFEEFDEEFLLEFVLVPGALDKIAPFYPVVKMHRAWFDRCLKQIHETIAECDAEDVKALNKDGKSTNELERIKQTNDKNTTREKDTKTPEAVPEKSGTHEKSEGKSKVGAGKPAQDKAPA